MDLKKEQEAKKSQHGSAKQKKKPTKAEDSKEINDAPAKLRSYAASKGISSPSYRDLGTIRTDTGTMHKIECSLGGISTVGVGAERAIARQNAAALMCKKLSVGKKK